MLLILHALGARIYAGVRVASAGDEVRRENNRDAQVFYWNYRTLEGHVEAGQRDFEVWSGSTAATSEFRTHAVSRAAETDALVRLGFRLLGRHKQVEFGRLACTRMALLTEARLRHLSRLDSTPSRTRHLAVWTAEKLGRLKLNGRLIRPSPLSAVTELEGCRLLLDSNRALWSGLGYLAIGPSDADERAGRAEELLAAAERLRLAAIERAAYQGVDATISGRDDPP